MYDLKLWWPQASRGDPEEPSTIDYDAIRVYINGHELDHLGLGPGYKIWFTRLKLPGSLRAVVRNRYVGDNYSRSGQSADACLVVARNALRPLNLDLEDDQLWLKLMEVADWPADLVKHEELAFFKRIKLRRKSTSQRIVTPVIPLQVQDKPRRSIIRD